MLYNPSLSYSYLPFFILLQLSHFNTVFFPQPVILEINIVPRNHKSDGAQPKKTTEGMKGFSHNFFQKKADLIFKPASNFIPQLPRRG